MKRLAVGIVVAGLAIGAIGYWYGAIPGTERFAIRRAKTVIANGLIDPASAQFRNIVFSVDRRSTIKARWVCGEINGKNRMGAYAGFTPFYVSEDGSQGDMLTQERPADDDVQAAVSRCDEGIKEGRYDEYTCSRKRELLEKRNHYDGWVGVYREACGNGLGIK